jgi:SAM-dependent methyltransferase
MRIADFTGAMLSQSCGRPQIRYDKKMPDSLDQFSESLRGSLEPGLRALFPADFVICSEHFERFTTETAARDLVRLELDRAFEEPRTIEEALETRGFVRKAAVPLRWMLDKLSEEGFFDAVPGTPPRFRLRRPLPTADSGAKDRALALAPACAPAFSIVEEVSRNVVEIFTGAKTGEDVLFSPSRLPLWFAYFNNDNLLYSVNNRLGAEAVARVLPATHPTAILELGGGAGSAAIALLERLEAGSLLERIAEYRFTEPVSTFLRRGERSLKARFPQVPITAAKLDMNLPFPDQGVGAATMDLVYAVNTVHVARDLAETLAHVRNALKPGGRAVFSECVRPRRGQPIYVEYIFSFLDNFVNVVRDPEFRPTHGFLTPGNWKAALSRAGFDRIEILPDVESLAREFPSFFVGAILARKP